MGIGRRVATVWSSRGTLGLLRFLRDRVLSRRHDLLFEVETAGYSSEPGWNGEGHLLWIRRENLADTLTPELRSQIGAGEGADYLEGLSGRDMLFLVVDEHGQWLHHSFVLFDTRTKSMLGEPADTPLFAHCVTAPGARGRQLYSRTLRCALGVLHGCGHARAVINCAPDNVASVRGITTAGFQLARRTDTWTVLTLLAWQTGRDKEGRCFTRLFLA